MGLSLGVVLALPMVAPIKAQEKPAPAAKPAKPAKPAEDRLDGTVKSVDKKAKALTVRLRGKNLERQVIYDDNTKFTYRNKAASLDDVKEERRVICLGKLNDKGQFMATRVDVRDKG